MSRRRSARPLSHSAHFVFLCSPSGVETISKLNQTRKQILDEKVGAQNQIQFRQLARSTKSSSTPCECQSPPDGGAFNDQINPDGATAELASWWAARQPALRSREMPGLRKQCDSCLTVVSSRLQKEFMRLIPKRRRCKNFSSASLLLQHRDKGRGRRRGERRRPRRCRKMRVPRRRRRLHIPAYVLCCEPRS